MSAPNPASRQAAELAQVMPPGIDRGGDLLGYDLAIGRQGALQSHDPNVVAQPDVVEHTLPSSSPPAQGTTDAGAGGDGAGDAAPAAPEH
jgi:hypothetical protein